MTRKRRLERFYAAFRKLRNDYPEVYMEAWTPDDFVTFAKKRRLSQEKAVCVVDVLDDWFDANHGTNWHTVENAVKHVEGRD